MYYLDDIGTTKTMTVDVGLFMISTEYKKWFEELIQEPFKSNQQELINRLTAISDFWTHGRASKTYGFSEFVYELKSIGTIIHPKARSCVLSAVKDDNIGEDQLLREAERIDHIMESVAGLRAYTVKAEEASAMNIDFNDYPMVRLTMVKREKR